MTLNNRILATDDDGRALAFDVLPADVISGADVYKSSQASALEGSIGGTVNMRSARPFDDPGLHAAARIEGELQRHVGVLGQEGLGVHQRYQRRRARWASCIGGVVSDTQDPHRLAQLQHLRWRQPGRLAPVRPQQPPVVAECCISFGSVIEEKKREALSGTLEWRPTDTLHLALDGLYTRLNDPQVGLQPGLLPGLQL